MRTRLPGSATKRTSTDSPMTTLPSPLMSIERCAGDSVAIPTRAQSAAVSERDQDPTSFDGTFVVGCAEALPTAPTTTTSPTAIVDPRTRYLATVAPRPQVSPARDANTVLLMQQGR